jgi:hypothetical protein
MVDANVNFKAEFNVRNIVLGTFGNTDTGDFGNNWATGTVFWYPTAYSPANDGVLRRIYIRCQTGIGNKIKAAIYDSSNNLLGQTSEGTPPAGYDWLKLKLTSPISVQSSASYYLAILSVLNISVMYTTTGTKIRYVAGSSFPDPLPAGSAGAVDESSIYGEYSIVASRDFKAGFIVAQGSQDLLGELLVRRTASQELKAQFHVVGPYTFGKTDVGGSNFNWAANRAFWWEVMYSPTNDGELLSIYVYCQNSGDTIEAAIYDSSRNLLAETSGSAPASLGWVKMDLAVPISIQSAASYFLVGRTTADMWTRYDSVGGGKWAAEADMPDPLPAGTNQTAEHSIYGEYIPSGSQELLGKFEVLQAGSVELKGEFFRGADGDIELKGEFFAQLTGSQTLLGEFVSQQAGLQELKASFEGQATRSLKAGFSIRQSGSQELLCEFVIRRAASQELKASFEGQATQNLKAEFISQGSSSQELLGKLIVRQSASIELKASFEGQGTESLLGYFRTSIQPIGLTVLGYFTVLQGSAQLKAGFTCKNADTSDLTCKVRISVDTTDTSLKAEFIAAIPVSINLPAEFEVRQETRNLKGQFFLGTDGDQDLLAEFISRQVGSEDLGASFTVKQWREELKAELVSQQASSVELLGEFEVQRSTNVELTAEFISRRPSTLNLAAEFFTQIPTENLKAEFICRNAGTANLLSRFIVRRLTDPYTVIVEDAFNAWLTYWERVGSGWLTTPIGIEDAIQKYSGANSYRLYLGTEKIGSESLIFGWARDAYSNLNEEGSGELLSEFVIRRSGSLNLSASFTVLQGYGDLKGSVKVTTPSSAEVLGEFISQQADSQELLAEFTVRQLVSRDLKAEFSVTVYDEELRAEFVSRQASSQELKGRLWIPGYTVSLLGEFIVRKAGSQELKASFEGQVTQNLLAEFMIRQVTSRDLLSKFVVRRETDSLTVLVDDNIDSWMSYWERVGTGFMVLPYIERDTEVKDSGANSIKIEILYAEDESEALKFGWSGTPYNNLLNRTWAWEVQPPIIFDKDPPEQDVFYTALDTTEFIKILGVLTRQINDEASSKDMSVILTIDGKTAEPASISGKTNDRWYYWWLNYVDVSYTIQSGTGVALLDVYEALTARSFKATVALVNDAPGITRY